VHKQLEHASGPGSHEEETRRHANDVSTEPLIGEKDRGTRSRKVLKGPQEGKAGDDFTVGMVTSRVESRRGDVFRVRGEQFLVEKKKNQGWLGGEGEVVPEQFITKNETKMGANR